MAMAILSLLNTANAAQRVTLITGFPTCGKSTIANILRDRSPQVAVIEAEHWLLPLRERRALGFSGAHPRSYDLERTLADLTTLSHGETLNLPTYSFLTHSLSERDSIRIEAHSPIILDGCIFLDRLFTSLISKSILLLPASIEHWIDNCVYRDIRERNFEPEFSKHHTCSKMRDMIDLLEASPLHHDLTYQCHGLLSQGDSLAYTQIAPYRISQLLAHWRILLRAIHG